MGYTTAIFVNETSKEMSASARTDDHAHWKMMEATEAAKGFRFMKMATGLDEEVARRMKGNLISSYELAGYRKVTR